MKKKFKLGLDVRTMSEKGTGIGRVKIEITKRLIKSLPLSEWEIHLFPGKDTEIKFNMPENVFIHNELRKYNSTAKRALWHCPYNAVKNRLDIFHSLDFLGPAWKKGFKLIQTIHDIIPLIFHKESSYKSVFMCRYIMPFMFKADDVIIVFSENTKKDLLKSYSIKEDKIKTIYLAGRDEFKEKIKEEEIEKVKQKYGIRKKYFIFTGTLEPKKNVVRIGEAFLEIQKKHKDFCFVFAGAKGWGVDELYKKTKNNTDIIFTGFVPDEDLIALVKGAYCFIFPSIYEGFGMPVLDAFNAGLPLITSKVASIPEIAEDAALSVDPYKTEEIAKAMNEMIENTQLREQLISKGKIQSLKFSWDKTVREIIKVYYEIIKCGS